MERLQPRHRCATERPDRPPLPRSGGRWCHRTIDTQPSVPRVAAMLYEITIWTRVTGVAQLLATRHELGHLSTVKELAKTTLREHPDVGPAHYVKVSEAHNGRDVFIWKLGGRG